VRTVDADLDDHLALCRAYGARMTGGQYFSHGSAALLHGLPLRRRQRPAAVHVSVFAPQKPPQMRGVVPHELQSTGHRITWAHGLPCISPQDTWAQLSARLDLASLVAIGDFIIGGDEAYSGVPSPTTVADLERAVHRHGRRRGVRELRRALELVRSNSLSPQESRLRVELVQAGLPEPRLNHRVFAGDDFVAMVDLAYPDQRVAIEYLGDHHRTQRETYEEDMTRRELLAYAGWNTIFLTSADVAPRSSRAVMYVRRALLRSTAPA
jgi:very-short-patch-repair endonuclease